MLALDTQRRSNDDNIGRSQDTIQSVIAIESPEIENSQILFDERKSIAPPNKSPLSRHISDDGRV